MKRNTTFLFLIIFCVFFVHSERLFNAVHSNCGVRLESYEEDGKTIYLIVAYTDTSDSTAVASIIYDTEKERAYALVYDLEENRYDYDYNDWVRNIPTIYNYKIDTDVVDGSITKIYYYGYK